MRIPCFVFLVVLTLLSTACSEADLATSAPMDAIEQQLEVARHEPLLALTADSQNQLTEFSTDGCSGGLSAAWEQLSGDYPLFAASHGDLPPWQACCVSHDRAYHVGGSGDASALESFARRRDADLALRACVLRTGPERSAALQTQYGLTTEQVQSLYETIADLMYRAVRLGGIPCTEAAWRWGYGWPKCEWPAD